MIPLNVILKNNMVHQREKNYNSLNLVKQKTIMARIWEADEGEMVQEKSY